MYNSDKLPKNIFHYFQGGVLKPPKPHPSYNTGSQYIWWLVNGAKNWWFEPKNVVIWWFWEIWWFGDFNLKILVIYCYIGDGDSRLVRHFIWPDSLIDQKKIPMK